MALVTPTEPVPLEELGRVHFVGIGGAGMSGIARIMLARGVAGLRQRHDRRLGRAGRAGGARGPGLRRPRGRPSRRRRHAGRVQRDQGEQPGAGRGEPPGPAGGAPGRRARLADVRPPGDRGDRHPRQDQHHVDDRHRSHRDERSRRGPRVRDRRRARGHRRRRGRRRRPLLRGRGGRERRLVPDVLAGRRRGHQRRRRPPGQLRDRGGLPRLVRRLPRPGQAGRPAGDLRGRLRHARPGRPRPRARAAGGQLRRVAGRGLPDRRRDDERDGDVVQHPRRAERGAAAGTSGGHDRGGAVGEPEPPGPFGKIDLDLQLRVPGHHNALNAAAAFAAAVRARDRAEPGRDGPGQLPGRRATARAQGRGPRRPGPRHLRPPPDRARRRPAGGPRHHDRRAGG